VIRGIGQGDARLNARSQAVDDGVVERLTRCERRDAWWIGVICSAAMRPAASAAGEGSASSNGTSD
jgi:hypothetical protein